MYAIATIIGIYKAISFKTVILRNPLNVFY